ncbi:hypothetical protein CBR_g916 [Chara braunii]|uniref:Uncharacterized protein n=1 Tax=Chara braunii TaxID=69332 RepID=A0A388KCJ8_CHABU|nr:hypothetical protein CBR_g916 [Chara braunii]|eukprot:GBG67792.1 hypothetical protein CBR_g916 [Chara braunii]
MGRQPPLPSRKRARYVLYFVCRREGRGFPREVGHRLASFDMHKRRRVLVVLCFVVEARGRSCICPCFAT